MVVIYGVIYDGVSVSIWKAVNLLHKKISQKIAE